MRINSHPEDRSRADEDHAPPEVIKVQGAGDALALVQHGLGFMPEESLVVVGLHRKRSGAHLRIDLRAGVDHPQSLARWVCEHLAGAKTSPHPDGAVIYLFTSEVPAPPALGDAALRPFAGLQESLVRLLRDDYGIGVVQTWWVGGGRIRDYDCEAESCCPYPGEDVEVAAHSAVHSHITARGRRLLQTPTQMVDEFLSAAPTLTAAMIERAAAVEMEQRALLDVEDEALMALLCWDELISEEQAVSEDDSATPREDRWYRGRAEQLGRMAASLTFGDLRDAIFVVAAESFHLAAVGLRVLRRSRAGEAPEEGVGRFRHVLSGSTGDRPSWDRVDALARLLAHLQPVMSDAGRAESLALMGWIEWARGRGTISGAYLDRCLDHVPRHPLGELLTLYTDGGAICPWAMVREHSWSAGDGGR